MPTARDGEAPYPQGYVGPAISAEAQTVFVSWNPGCLTGTLICYLPWFFTIKPLLHATSVSSLRLPKLNTA